MTDFPVTATDGFFGSDALSFSAFPGATINETFTIQDLFDSIQYKAGASIVDAFEIQHTDSSHAIFKISRSDVVKLQSAVARAIVGTLGDTVNFHDARKIAIAVTILAKIQLGEELDSIGIFGRAIADAVIFSSALQWFYGGFLHDTIEMTTDPIPLWQRVALVTDGTIIGDVLVPTLQIRVDLADGFDIDDETALKMIFSASIEDGFEFSVAYIDPGGGFTAWAINTRTSAVTEYDDFAFNSFAQMGNHFLGATSTGLYVLDGTLDATESIVARIKSGSAQFSGSHFTAFDAAYLGCRVEETGRTWILKLHAGDGREYVYKFRPLNRRTSKIFFGKGLRSRYFSWELITAGEDFDLDDLEFVPIGSKRRT